MLANKRLEIRRRVDVGHWDHLLVSTNHRMNLLPRRPNLKQIRHIRHAATRRKVGQNHHFVLRCQNVRTFRHEMDPAEDDKLRLWRGRGELRELVAVPPKIRMLNNFVTLIVVAKNHQSRTQLRPCRSDPITRLVIAQIAVLGRQWRLVHLSLSTSIT